MHRGRIAAALALLLLGACHCHAFGDLKPKDRIASSTKVGGWSVESSVHYEGWHHTPPFHFLPEDSYSTEQYLEVVHAATGVRSRLGSIHSLPGSDRASALRYFDALGMEVCADPDGRRAAVRWTLAPAGRTAGDFHVLYLYPGTVARSLLPPKAATCQEALARSPSADDWPAQEMALVSEPQLDDPTRAYPPDFAVSWRAGDRDYARFVQSQRLAAFVVAVRERVAIEKALEFALLRRIVDGQTAGEVAALRDHVARGRDAQPDLEAHLYEFLLPDAKKTVYVDAEASGPFASQLVAAAPDPERRRDFVQRALTKWAAGDFDGLCAERWRLEALLSAAQPMVEPARCEAFAALVPPFLKDTHCPEAGARLVFQAVAGCLPPEKMKRLALATLNPFAGKDESAYNGMDSGCNLEAKGGVLPPHCRSLVFNAASWLLAHCDRDAVATAHAALGATHAPVVQTAALCVIGHCQGTAALEAARDEAAELKDRPGFFDTCDLLRR